MHCIHCRITGSSRNLPKPHYPPLIPMPKDHLVGLFDRRNGFCRITSHSMEDHHYVPRTAPDDNELWARRGSAPCRVMSKSHSMEAHHYIPNFDNQFSHVEGCKVTHKYRSMRDYRYVYPVLMMEVDKTAIEDQELRELQFSLSYLHHLTEDYQYVAPAVFNLDDLKIKLGVVEPMINAGDQRHRHHHHQRDGVRARANQRHGKYVYSVCDELCSLIVPEQLESILTQAKVDNMWLTTNRKDIVIETRAGNVVTVPASVVTSEELHEALQEKSLMPGQAGGQHVVKLIDSLNNGLPRLKKKRSKSKKMKKAFDRVNNFSARPDCQLSVNGNSTSGSDKNGINGNGSSCPSSLSDSSDSLTSCSSSRTSVERDGDVVVASIVNLTAHTNVLDDATTDYLSLNKRCVLVKGPNSNELRRISSDDWDLGPLIREEVDEALMVAPRAENGLTNGHHKGFMVIGNGSRHVDMSIGPATASFEDQTSLCYSEILDNMGGTSTEVSSSSRASRTSLTSNSTEKKIDSKKGSPNSVCSETVECQDMTTPTPPTESTATSASSISSVSRSKRLEFHANPVLVGNSRKIRLADIPLRMLSSEDDVVSVGLDAVATIKAHSNRARKAAKSDRNDVTYDNDDEEEEEDDGDERFISKARLDARELARTFKEKYGRFTSDDDEFTPSSSTNGFLFKAHHRTLSAEKRANALDALVVVVQLAGYTPGLRSRDLIEHYVVTTDYSPDETDVGSIALREGQVVEIVDQSKRSRWLVRTRASKYLSPRQGWVPTCYLEKKTVEERSLYAANDETDYKSDSKEQEAAKKRRTIVRELVETEEEFVKDMEHVVHTYLKEMDNPRMPKELKDQRDAIFLNFKEICDFHNNVLIKGVQYYAGEPSKLGKTFLRLERDFDMHANYCQQEQQAQAVLATPLVKEYFEEYSKRIGEIDRSLSDHLKLPIQRINDYQLLLRELIKYSTILDEDCADLQRALDLMLGIPRRAHDLQYINNIHGFKGNIHKLGRLLRHQDWFVVKDAEGRSKERYLFLFKSRIFVTKVKNLSEFRKTFILRDIIRLADVEIEDISDDDKSFRLHHIDSRSHPRYPLVLEASSPDVKKAWIKDIAEVANNILAVVTDPVEEEVEIAGSQVQDTDDNLEIFEELETDEQMSETSRFTKVEVNESKEEVHDESNAPKFQKSLKSTTYVHGETATLECELSSSAPTATVTWLKNNVPLDQSSRLRFVTKGNSQYLIIEDVESHDSGLYTCRGINKNGSVSCSSQLNVQGPDEMRHDLPVSPSPKSPEFVIKFKDTVLPEGTSVRFLVKVRASPEADIKFFKDGRALKENDRVKIVYEDNSTFELSVAHVTQKDAGVYSCTARNHIGEKSFSANVKVSADKDVFQGLEDVPLKKQKLLKPGEQPEFKWFRDGHEMEASERFQVILKDDEDSLALIFQHVKPEDAGLYTCVASTSSGRIACSAELTVQGMVNQFLRTPEAPKITLQLTDTEVSQGASAMLDLKVTGFPKPQISWVKDGVEVKAGGRFKFLREDDESISLVIKNVDYNDAGKYVVVARNELGQATTSGQLIVRAPPKFKKQMKDMAVMTDEPVRFEIEVEGRPPPELTWYKDGQIIKESERIKIVKTTEDACALFIKKVIQEDAGSYSIVASNSSGKISEFGNLVVNDAPRFMKQMKSAKVKEHDTIKFEVKVSGFPEPTVKWLKDGQALRDDGKHIKIDQDDRVHTLTIDGVKREDAGKFTCEISSDSGSAKGDGDLTVFSAPAFLKKLSDLIVREGDSDVRLEVNVSGCPDPKIRWFIEKLEIDESSRKKCRTVEENESRVLIINKVNEESAGSYSCKITNEYGETSCQGTVTVLTKPKFEETISDLRVIENEDVSYTVKVKGNPAPTVKWYKENQEVNVSANVKIGASTADGTYSLKLNNVNEDSAGDYECRATNSEGVAVTVSKLVVIKKQEAAPAEPEEESVEATVYKLKPIYRETADVLDGENDGEEKYKNEEKKFKDEEEQFEEKKKQIEEEEEEEEKFKDQEINLENERKSFKDEEEKFDEENERFEDKEKKLEEKKEKFEDKEEKFEDKEKKFEDEEEKFEGKKERLRDKEKFLEDHVKETRFDEELQSKDIDEKSDSLSALPKMKNKRLQKMTSYSMSTSFAMSSSKSYAISSDGAVKMTAEFSSESVFEESDDSGTKSEKKREHCFERFSDSEDVKFSIREVESDFGNLLTVNPEGEDWRRVSEISEGIVNESPELDRDETFLFRKSSKSVGSSSDTGLSIVEIVGDDLSVATEEEDVKLNIRKYVPLDKARHDEDDGKERLAKVNKPEGRISADDVRKSSEENDVEFKNRRNREKDEIDRELKDLQSEAKKSTVQECLIEERPSTARSAAKDRILQEPLSTDSRIDKLEMGSVVEVVDSEDLAPRKKMEHDERLTKKSVRSESNKDGKDELVKDDYRYVEEKSAHPKFDGKFKDVDVWNGEDGVLEVVGTGIPTPEVKWYKDGEVLEDDKRIKFEDDGKVHRVLIKGTVPEDSGEYKCELTNELGVATEEGKLNIKTAFEAKAPVLLKSLESAVVVEGHPVTFQAKIYATPDPDIKWFKDGEEVKSGGRLEVVENQIKHAYILNIGNVKPEDSGKYTVKASNAHGEITSEAVLDVQTYPVIDDIKDKKAMPESAVSFDTKVTGKPLPSVNWTKGSSVLVNSEKVKIESDSAKGVYRLNLNGVSPEDSGEYACVAKNEAGNSSAPFKLTVTTEAPHFIKGLHSIDAKLNQSVALDVQVYGLPMPTVKWFKGDMELADTLNIKLSQTDERNFSLAIDRMSEEASGKYTCKAINSAGEAVTHATVTLISALPVFLKNLPKEVCVISGEPFVLEAKLENEPMPQIKWTKDGNEIKGDNGHIKTEVLPDGTVHLSVDNTLPEDKGKYTLVAISDAGEQASTSRVAVEAVPKAPSFVKELKDAVVAQGDSLALEAVVAGHPQPSAKWLKDGKPVKLDSRTRFLEKPGGRFALEIDNVKSEDAGKYTLQVSNTHGTRSSDSNVSVPKIAAKAPEFLENLKSLDILDGLPCQLTAKVSGFPLPDIKWYKNGQLLSDDADEQVKAVVRPDGSVALLFVKALLGDAGQYTCEASNPHGSCKSNADLGVTGRDVEGERKKSPSFVVPLRDVCVDEGKPFKLQAQIEGNPFPDITWTKDDTPLKMGGNVSHYCDGDKVCLEVHKASPVEDAGKYKCHLSNSEGKAHSNATADVNKLYTPPKFTQRFTDSTIVLGGDAHFVGRVSGFPKPDVTWYLNDTPLHDSTHYKIKRDGDMCALQIKKTTVADRGKYTCKAVNDVGSDNCVADLEIKESAPEKKERGEAPSFLKKLGDCSIVDGMPAKFTACVTGIPEPDFKWFKDGIELKDSDRVKSQVEPHGLLRLVIKNAVPSDAGRYTLKISNPHGEAESTGQLMFETFEERKPRSKLPDSSKPREKEVDHVKTTDDDDGGKPKDEVAVGDKDLSKTWDRPDDYLKSKKPKDEEDGVDQPSRNGHPEDLDSKRPKDGTDDSSRPRVKGDDSADDKNKDRNKLGDLSKQPRDKVRDVNGDQLKSDKDSKPRDEIGDDSSKKSATKKPKDDGGLQPRDKPTDKTKSIDRNGYDDGLPKDRDHINGSDYDGPRPHNDYDGSRPHNDYEKPRLDKYDDRRKPKSRDNDDYRNDYDGDRRYPRPRDHGKDYDRPRDKYGDHGRPKERDDAWRKPRDGMADMNIDYEKFRRSAIPLALSDKPIISKMTDRRLTLSWKPSLPIGPSVPVTYIVDMCEVRVPAGDWFAARSGVRGCCCEIRNLEPFRDYKFRVRVENKYGISDPSPFATAYRTKLEMTPPRQLSKLPPQFDFRPESSPYFPKDYDIDRPLHDEYAHAPHFLRQQDEVQYGVKGQESNVEWWVYGYPTPEATFTFNGEPIDAKGRYEYAVARNGQCKLYLNRMLDRDVGVYECIARNEHGEARQRVRLEIAEHPHFIEHLEEETMMVRKSGTIRCRVVGVPYPELKWYKDWHPIVSSDRIRIEWKEPDLCTLTINGVIAKDSGLYSCAARNIAGVATTSSMVYVEEDENDFSFLKYSHSRVVRAHPKPVVDMYDIGDELGRGTQSIVYHAVERSTGNSYAAKTMYGGGSGVGAGVGRGGRDSTYTPPVGVPDLRAAMHHELDIMNQLHNRYLIRASDAYQIKDSFTIITELASGGELLDSICKQSYITESDVAHYIRQILWGLEHMHGKGFAHLGLTPGDLLLARPGGDDIKICDFGLANRIIKGKDLFLEYGMPEYVAPEIANRRPVTFGTDMWSIGVITYLLLSGISPFLGENDRETLRRIQKGHLTFDSDVFRTISDEAKDFISKLLIFDSSARMDIKSALNHSWLKFADRPGSGEPLSTDRLRAYFDKYRTWMANSSCNRYYRRRPLSSAFDHPSCMVYPPGERYTPPGSPDTTSFRGAPSPLPDAKLGEPREHEDLNHDLGYADSTSHYQNGPDTYLLQLRDVGLPLRLREYMRVTASASPSLALRLSDTISGKDVTIRERRRFTDVMDEEIDDEKHGELNGLRRRIYNEVSPRSETKNRIKELLPCSRENETAPYFREKLLDTALVDEQPAELSCLAIGFPVPVVTWYRNDVLMSETHRVRSVQDARGHSILKFSPAKVQDAGVYKAVARSPAGQASCRARFRQGDTPGNIDPPTFGQVSDTEVLVTWHPPKFDGHSSIVCYALQYKDIGDAEWREVANNISHLFMVVRGLQANSKYEFRVKPLNGFGWGEFSATSAVVETKEPGAEKVTISKALKSQQEVTERGRAIDVVRRRVSLDYSIECNPVVLIEDARPTDKYDFVSEIARGRFSVIVKCCERSDNNRVFAAKLLDASSDALSAMHEYDTFKTLRHERIPCLCEAYHDPSTGILVLVQEKLVGCDILTYLTRSAEYTEDTVAKAIGQVMDALEYLHFRGIVHLDVQPDNVVVSDLNCFHVKLVDYGSARHVDRYAPPKAQKAGILEYMAPEVLNQEELTNYADIWGVGVLTYVLLSGVSPFSGANQAETMQNITYVRYRFEHLYKDVTPEATRFLMLTFKRTPQKRPTADECLETSKWLNPSDLMLRKRERTVFASNKLHQYADDYHRQRQNVATTSERLLNAFGTHYSRSSSVDFEKMTTF